LVRDDPKLLDDSEGEPKPNGVVGGSILSREIASLLDGKLAMWSSTSRVPKKSKNKNFHKDPTSNTLSIITYTECHSLTSIGGYYTLKCFIILLA
jgi:hypothetical protein